MTLAEVRRAVREIKAKAVAGDYEAAFRAEDALYQTVLEAIAARDEVCAGHISPDGLAAEALKTKCLKFARRTA